MATIDTTVPNRGRTSSRLIAMWALAMLIARATLALTPLQSIRYSPDITVVLGGATVTPQNIAQDNLAGTVSLVNIGTIPAGTAVTAYSPLANGDQFLAFDTTLTLGSLTVRPGDVVRLHGATYTLEFDATANGIPNGVITDAVVQISPNDLLLSFDVTVAIGTITATPKDLVRFKNGVFSLFFDGTAAGVPAGLDIDAVDCLSRNAHLLISFDGSGVIGGVSFDDEDVLEYNPVSNTWELAYDGSAQHAGWPPADLSALSAAPAVPPSSVPPLIQGSNPGPGGVGGAGGVGPGTTRVFGIGTPHAKPNDSCIQIFSVGPNGLPDNPPGSVDDEPLGTGGTDAAGNFVDVSGAPGIMLSRPVRVGETLFAFDACENLAGTVIFVTAPAPLLSPVMLLVACVFLGLLGVWTLRRQSSGV